MQHCIVLLCSRHFDGHAKMFVSSSVRLMTVTENSCTKIYLQFFLVVSKVRFSSERGVRIVDKFFSDINHWKFVEFIEKTREKFWQNIYSFFFPNSSNKQFYFVIPISTWKIWFHLINFFSDFVYFLSNFFFLLFFFLSTFWALFLAPRLHKTVY